MFRIFTLQPGDAAPFNHLTFPLYRPLLNSADPAITRIGATCGEAPAGLALANRENVLSLAVGKAHRNRGLATSLLAALENALINQGMQYAWLTYMGDVSSATALERVLEKSGWQTPRPRMVVCRSTIQRLVEGPWVRRHARFTATPWKDVPPDALDALRVRADYPSELSPFLEEEKIEKINSIALLVYGEIAGWMITHRVNPTTIRYTKLYMRDAHRRLGFALVAESLARHADSHLAIEAPNCCMDYQADNRSMSNFVQRHLGSTLTSVTITKGSVKRLWENQRSVLSD